MICILHGYLLEGSGSNLWTRETVRALCRAGKTVHLVCQDNSPERYDFITEANRYHLDGSIETVFQRDVPYSGRCIFHKPEIGDMLPVYVWGEYEEFSNVVPMVNLSDQEIEGYCQRNVEVLRSIVQAHEIKVLNANHAVLMPVVAQRVTEGTSIPFTIMPHGSALEYVVKVDERFLHYAEEAFASAKRIFAGDETMKQRLRKLFGQVPDLDAKMTQLPLGVDSGLFQSVPRNKRKENITSLFDAVREMPRGKGREQEVALRDQLSRTMTLDDLQIACLAAQDYAVTSPDADLEAKLNAIDWEQERSLVFVGRLIANKGLHAVVAALPLILDMRPDLQLFVVGHGPLR